MQAAPICLGRVSVTDGLVTEQEYAFVLQLFRASVADPEARARVRNVSLCPVSVASAACQAYGRCDQTVKLLKGLSALPKRWEQVRAERPCRACSRARIALPVCLLRDHVSCAMPSSPFPFHLHANATFRRKSGRRWLNKMKSICSSRSRASLPPRPFCQHFTRIPFPPTRDRRRSSPRKSTSHSMCAPLEHSNPNASGCPPMQNLDLIGRPRHRDSDRRAPVGDRRRRQQGV